MRRIGGTDRHSRGAVLPGHRAQRLRNLVHSAVLALGMALIAAACAWILFGADGVLWAALAVGLAALLTPSIAPDVVLSLRQARPLGRRDFPQFYALLDELARRAGLSVTPRLFHLPSALLNACRPFGSAADRRSGGAREPS